MSELKEKEQQLQVEQLLRITQLQAKAKQLLDCLGFIAHYEQRLDLGAIAIQLENAGYWLYNGYFIVGRNDSASLERLTRLVERIEARLHNLASMANAARDEGLYLLAEKHLNVADAYLHGAAQEFKDAVADTI